MYEYKNPPKERICDIRINLSLAMIMNIDVENSTTIYDELEDAKVNLYNNNCATRFGDKGDSKEDEESEEEKRIEEELREIQKKANQTRQDNNERYEQLGNYEYYRGKKW